MTNYQKSLKDIIVNKKYEKIKDYLLRIIIYLALLVLDIFLIIIWFALWGCFCCKSKKSFASGCSKCLYFIFIFFSVISILISVFGFFIIPCFYKSSNDIICSLYKIVFHFIEGVNNDIPASHWKNFLHSMNPYNSNLLLSYLFSFYIIYINFSVSIRWFKTCINKICF